LNAPEEVDGMQGQTSVSGEPAGRAATYALVAEQVTSLLEGCPGPVAAMASAAALLKSTFDHYSWVGFYLPQADGSLVVGPYQGPLACVVLPAGKGVCAASAAARQTMLVPDVHAFPGHIACDTRSRSEIVVPLVTDGLLAVLDVDSHLPDAFNADDKQGLEAIAERLARAWRD
jgi:GAF domain-containing protein